MIQKLQIRRGSGRRSWCESKERQRAGGKTLLGWGRSGKGEGSFKSRSALKTPEEENRQEHNVLLRHPRKKRWEKRRNSKKGGRKSTDEFPVKNL